MNQLEKTADTIDQDGWIHSGDMGKLDKDGFLFITGRLKELIITSGGENIPPIVIEDNIKSALPIVSNVMLVGDKRKYLTALVTLKSKINMDTMEFETDIVSSRAANLTIPKHLLPTFSPRFLWLLLKIGKNRTK